MTMKNYALLGVNIDHVATLRQLRGTPYPSLIEAAASAIRGGADQITVHLREDRRHIQDEDVKQLRAEISVPLNLEMAATPEMTSFATKVRPDWICLVPEKRKEVTTEGGLDLKGSKARVARVIKGVADHGIKVSLFIEPDLSTIKLAAKLGAQAVEIHTGLYCRLEQEGRTRGLKRSKDRAGAELKKIFAAAALAKKLGLEAHAGHGFDTINVRPVAAELDDSGKPLIEEFNIGHAIVCRAAIVGMERAVREMVAAVAAP